MRNTLNLLIALTLASSANATDRVVSTSGTYNTISSAIAASSDGDRVLVEPGTYTENIVVNKALTLAVNTEGGRFTISGLVEFVTGNTDRKITVIGARGLSQWSTEEAGPGRLDLHIIDSYLSSAVFTSTPSSYVVLFRDTINTSLSLTNGSVIGNRFTGAYNGNSPLTVAQGTVLPNALYVVGNSFGQIGGVMADHVMNIGFNKEFHVENNYASVTSTSTTFFVFNGQQEFGTRACTILNNTFYRTSTANLSMIWGNNNNASTVVIKNNVSINNTGTFVVWTNRVGDVSNNVFGAGSWINTSTGQPVNGSPLINAGDPDPRYLDLDLTTNDAGCYGGSNSRANFTTPMGSAVVGFMQAPRVVAQGETVNIHAVGFDR